MFALKHSKNRTRSAAIVASHQGLSIASVTAEANSKALLDSYTYLQWDEQTPKEKIINSTAKKYGLVKRPCITTMELGSYSVLSVEAPQVPTAELRSAVRWQIKDLIDFHIDDAVLDVFDAPASGADHKQHNLYVVVSKLSKVKERVALLQDAYVNLTTIDIPELVLRNIAALLPEDSQGVAMVYLQRHQGVLILTRQSSLYLARTLDLGYESLLSASEDNSAAMGEAVVNSSFDKLVLELQRSFDYYDRHFMQPPLSGVVFAPMPQDVPGLTDYIRENLGIACRELELGQILQFRHKLDRKQQADGVLAIGAALRQERAVL